MEKSQQSPCCKKVSIQYIIYVGDDRIIYRFHNLKKFVEYKKIIKEKLSSKFHLYTISIITK